MNELRAPRLTCQDVVELLSDYLEGVLPARTRARVRAHLETSPECMAYQGQLRATIGAVGRLREHDVPVPILERLVAAFRGWRSG
jgi:anti-sigma factor RsiW